MILACFAQCTGFGPLCGKGVGFMVMRIGVDLGGTKIEIAALDDGGAMRHRERVDTPAGGYAATVAAIAPLGGEAGRSLGVPATGGAPTSGALSFATGPMKNPNSLGLKDQAPKKGPRPRRGPEGRE